MIIKNNRWSGKRRFLYQLVSPSFFGTFNKKVDSVMLDEMHDLHSKSILLNDSEWAKTGIDNVLFYSYCLKNDLTPHILNKITKKLYLHMKIYLYSMYMFFVALLSVILYQQISNTNQYFMLAILFICIIQLALNFLIACHRIKQIEIGAFFKRRYLLTNIKNITNIKGPLFLFSKIALTPSPLNDIIYKELKLALKNKQG